MFPLGQAHVENVTDIPRSEDLFDLGKTEHASLFDSLGQPWEVLPRIGGYLRDTLEPRQLGQAHSQTVIEGDVFIGEGTLIEAGALIRGPVWIGRNCLIGHGATLRDNVIVGDGCVVGHAAELKNSLLFNGCDVPHFNYVGDSILGFGVNLGAGTKLSNVRNDRRGVLVTLEDGTRIDTGLRKMGALIGDGCEVGCNVVTNPGAILAPGSMIKPNETISGFYRGRRS